MLDEVNRAKIVITNYHAFKLRERIDLSKGGRSLLQGRGEELNTLETEGQMLIIGSVGWLLNIIVLRNSFLAGPSTGRAAVGALRPQMNFLTPLSLGLEIQIHGSEPRGRRAKDWRSSSHIVERYWFWTAWSLSKIRLVHKRDGYVSLASKPFCAS
jgi:hypothetical protein